MREILSVRDVAALCAVAPSTVQYWERSGFLKSFKTLGGHRRFEKETVMAFLSLRGRKMNGKKGTPHEKCDDRRSEPRFPVSFAAVASIENALAATLPSRGRLCDISTNGCSIEFPADQSIEHDINSYIADKRVMKIETEAGSAIIKTPLNGSIRNFSLKEGLLRIGLSFN